MGLSAHYARLRPLRETDVTRTIIFLRDSYACQYCGIAVTYMSGTLDHVIPKAWYRTHPLHDVGDASILSNMVVACAICNTRKGCRLPDECGMIPKNPPRVPHTVRLDHHGVIQTIQKQLVVEYISRDLDTGLWTSSKMPPRT